MLKWYLKYCLVAVVIGTGVGFLVGEWFMLQEYIVVPGRVVPTQTSVNT